MNPRRLFLATAIALAILAGYNVAIARRAHTSQRQQARAALERIPASTEVLFLGNSLMESGCNMTAFAAAWPRREGAPPAVNLALGATTPVEHYLLLKHALEGPVRPKYIVYGFFDDQLNAETHGDWSDLIGNRALSYYYPDEAAELYAPGSTLKRWQLQFTQKVPLLSERSSLWSAVEDFRRKLEDVGLPARKRTRFGRVDDFAALAAKNAESFQRRIGDVVGQKRGFSRPVQEILELALSRGTKIVFVEMPMPSRHRTTFYSMAVWSKMRAHLQALATEAGASYLVASDWVEDDAKFEDAVHLNEDGAKFFSGKLADAISQLDGMPTKQLAVR